MTELEATTTKVSEALNRFRDERRARLGPAEEDLHAAKRFAERVARLRNEAAEWGTGDPRRGRVARRSAAPRALPWAPRSAETDTALPWLSLKELYRSLARALHPDFATTDVERRRRSELMARVNAAYGREDRVLLELLHEEATDGVSDEAVEERANLAERRAATLASMVASLERGLSLSCASSSWKDCEAARKRAERGHDYFVEMLYELRRSTKDVVRGAFEGAAELEASLRPLRERASVRPSREQLMRKAALRQGGRRAGEEGRRLAADLKRAASREPWLVVLSCLALFGEASSEPSPGVASLDAARARYELLTAEMPGAPRFEDVVLRLPPFLELGLRAYPKRLAFGIQVKSPTSLAGIRAALSSNELSPLARRALSVMGTEERCTRCRASVFVVHLLRTRGAGEVHGLACPACGTLRRSYRIFGAPEGLEALAPFARELGSVVEQPLRVGKTDLVLGFLPVELRRLNAKTLLDRFAALHLEDEDESCREHLRLYSGTKMLTASAAIRPGTRLRLSLAGGAPSSLEELEARLVTAARARYR
jgi:hypothetical protein